MKYSMTALTAALLLLVTSLPASAGDKSVDLSGTWDVRVEIPGREGAKMVIVGSHRLKRTSVDNYARESVAELSLSHGDNLLKLGKITVTATVKLSPTEECETVVTMAYEAPKTTPTKTLEAIGIPVEQYKALTDNMSKTSPEELNEDSSCDTVSIYSRDKVVLDIGNGGKATYIRTK